MRITVNGQREEMRIKKSVKPSLWNQAKEVSRGKDKNSRELNDYIENTRIHLFQIFTKLEQDVKKITAEILKNKFFGMDDEDNKTLLVCMREHNKQCRQLIGIDYADVTVRRYKCCTRYLQELIEQKYGEQDLLLKEVNREFVKNFEFFMKTEKKCQNNTVIRYMKCLKKVINLAIANEWMSRNPFARIKFHEVEVHTDFLTQEEIDKIYTKEFEIPRLELVRDLLILFLRSLCKIRLRENAKPG
ncbi:MAG: phage integrase SAM-like domain-containing protein [Bacteroides sp.]|nr:phage integrase SAM-like domain-containing protein [Bacteroides sp.]